MKHPQNRTRSVSESVPPPLYYKDMPTTELSLLIEGMHCGSCVARVDKALRGVPGVTDAAVNLTTNTARVTGTPNPDQLLAAVEHAGYKARLLADMSAQTVRDIAERGRQDEQA